VKGKIEEITGTLGDNIDLEAEGKKKDRRSSRMIGEIKKVVGKNKG
jgi:uncharacterized protein YjbJ (UPF0337 family)